MKTFLTLFLLLIYQTSDADFWTQKASFPGAPRRGAFAFSIGNKGYVGCGQTVSAGGPVVQDFWEYNKLTNTWTQKADFGGGIRMIATGFSIKGKGYAGLGYSGMYRQDFWEYDTTANSWTQKSNFGGAIRASASSFSNDSLGYICGGYNTTAGIVVFNDLWSYDPVIDTWTQRANLLGVARTNAVGFTISNKGYIGTGATAGAGVRLKDFWEYDMVADSWTQKTDFLGPGVCDDVGFAIGNKGYIGSGELAPCCTFAKTFYEYDVSLNQWIQKANIGGVDRDEGIGFSIGNKGYCGLGGQNGPIYNDFWEYTPDTTTNIQEFNVNKLSVIIFPNPFADNLEISNEYKEPSEIILYDITSRNILQKYFKKYIKINTEQFAKGTYLYEIRCGSNVCKKGKLVKI